MFFNPKLSNYLLPEWCPVQAILLAWPYAGSDWDVCLLEAKENYRHILKTLLCKQQVIVLLHPTLDQSEWESSLSFSPELRQNLSVINHIFYDDTWVRDYGPLSLSNGYLNCVFNGWGGKYLAINDNAVNKQLFEKNQDCLISTDIVLEGGALEVNSQKVLLANKLCVLDKNRNHYLSKEEYSTKEFEEKLRNLLGVETIIWLDNICLTGDDTDGHIDTLARFANDTAVIYSGRNEKHHDKNILENLHHQITNICTQNNFQSIELPTPIVNSMVDGHFLPASYANYLCSNETIYVPKYNVNEDQEALAIFEQTFEPYEIVPIDCTVLLEQHGSLHCATMQLHHSLK